ncbi:MAG: hypothetical protein ACKV0T_09610 [Planctomycetales bacterium]
MVERPVIDASVVAKWFLSDEPDKSVAGQLLLLLLANKVDFPSQRSTHVVGSAIEHAAGGMHGIPPSGESWNNHSWRNLPSVVCWRCRVAC